MLHSSVGAIVSIEPHLAPIVLKLLILPGRMKKKTALQYLTKIRKYTRFSSDLYHPAFVLKWEPIFTEKVYTVQQKSEGKYPGHMHTTHGVTVYFLSLIF